MSDEFVIYLKGFKPYSLEFDENDRLYLHIADNCVRVDAKKALWDLLEYLAKNGKNQVEEVWKK